MAKGINQVDKFEQVDKDYEARVDEILRQHQAQRLTYAAERRRDRTEKGHRETQITGSTIEQNFRDFEMECLLWKEIEDGARLAGITERQEKCLMMRYHLRSTVRETAEFLGISERTVKRDTTKAIRRIKNYWMSHPYALIWEVLREVFGSRIMRLVEFNLSSTKNN